MKAPARIRAKLESKKLTDPRVEVVRVRSRPAHVVRIGDALKDLELQGAIVWVQPVRGSTPEQVAATVQQVRKAGAVRAIPLPLVAEDAPVPVSVHDSVQVQAGVRAVVEELLVEVTEQPIEVRAIVEQALSEAGL
jgi:hypothetical protein